MPIGFGIYWFIKRIDLRAKKIVVKTLLRVIKKRIDLKAKVCIDLNSSKELQKNGPKAEKYMYLV